jgi:hypothetical protein
MSNHEPTTCGEGLAANAALPAKLAELIAAQADVLDRHTRALDPSDATARQELEVYKGLERTHRDVASALHSLADSMTGYRKLAMAEHNMEAMANPGGQSKAFQRFVAIERELLELLQEKLEAETKLLK